MNLRFQWVSENTPTELVLLLLAFLLSGLIGLERQRQMKSAGLRTHVLVGVGASLFTLVSGFGFAWATPQDGVIDPTRIAAQVVSGVGFLGGGVIFVRRSTVNGVTTAASIWLVAGVGMACGAGMPLIAAVSVLLYLIAVVLLHPLSRRVSVVQQDAEVLVRYVDGSGVLREVLGVAAGLGFRATLRDTRRFEAPAGGALIDVELSFLQGLRPVSDLVERLGAIRGVQRVTVLPEA